MRPLSRRYRRIRKMLINFDLTSAIFGMLAGCIAVIIIEWIMIRK